MGKEIPAPLGKCHDIGGVAQRGQIPDLLQY
jgi:hypothetical protein